MNEVFAVIGFASGLFGSVLGILTFLYFLNDRATRLRILLKMSYNAGGGMYNIRYPFVDFSDRVLAAETAGRTLCPGIEVINIGRSVFVIDEVGFALKKNLRVGRHMMFPDLVLPDMKRPFRLNPGESLVLYATETSIFDLERGINYIYATTSTEKTVFKRLSKFRLVMAKTATIFGK